MDHVRATDGHEPPDAANGRRRAFDINVSALSRERTKGTVKVTVRDASGSIKANGTISGKWLASSCGSVK